MKLSVIILNYNVSYFLELCLKSVQSAITTIDEEIIVVDNGSDDNTKKIIDSYSNSKINYLYQINTIFK